MFGGGGGPPIIGGGGGGPPIEGGGGGGPMPGGGGGGGIPSGGGGTGADSGGGGGGINFAWLGDELLGNGGGGPSGVDAGETPNRCREIFLSEPSLWHEQQQVKSIFLLKDKSNF